MEKTSRFRSAFQIEPAMSSIQIRKTTGILGAAVLIPGAPAFASAQGVQGPKNDAASRLRGDGGDSSESADGDVARGGYAFKSRADSISWARNRGVAERAKGF